MERAITLQKISQFSEANLTEIDRIYFGEEFCERLLPSFEIFGYAIMKARRLNKKFSLLTPIVTDFGLEKTRQLICLLRKEDEVIINDLGVLEMVNEEFKNPVVIGRILGRNILHALNVNGRKQDTLQEYLLLLSPRLRMIETDYFNAYRVNDFLAKDIDFSFHKEPFFWTTTRRCAFNTASKPLDKFAACNKECLKSKALLINTAVNKRFLLGGNKIINISRTIDSKLNSNLFKRIVFKMNDKNGLAE